MSKINPRYNGNYAPGEINVNHEGRLLRRVASKYGPINSIVAGFNSFIEYDFPLLLNSITVKAIDSDDKLRIQFTRYDPVTNITPFDAIEQSITYQGKLYGRIITIDSDGNETPDTVEIALMEFPVMTGSVLDGSVGRKDYYDTGNCPYYPGGMTIIGGRLQQVINETKLRTNMVMLYPDSETHEIICTMTSMSPTGKGEKMIMYFSDIKPSKGDDIEPDELYDGSLMIHLPEFGSEGKKKKKKKRAKLFHIFSILGDEDTESVKERILSFVREEQKAIVYQLMDKESCLPKKQAIQIVKAKLSLHSTIDLEEIVHDQTYPIAPEDKKLTMLSYMSSIYYRYKAGLRPEDNRNAMGFTKLETPEVLMIKYCAIHIDNIYQTIKPSRKNLHNLRNTISQTFGKLGSDIRSCYSQGNWAVKSAKTNTSGGLAQDVEKDSLLRTQSVMTKNSSATGNRGSQKDTRSYNPTQAGYNDPKDSHEGDTIGLNRQLSAIEWTSINRNPYPIEEFLEGVLADTRDTDNLHPVFLNGVIMGYGNGPVVVKLINQERRLGGSLREYFDILLCYDPYEMEVQIDTSAGRTVRPLLTATTDGLHINWKLEDMDIEQCLDEGYIEFVDAQAAEKACLIAESIDYQRRCKDEIKILETRGDYDHGVSIRRKLILPSTRRPPLQKEDKDNIVAYRKRMSAFTHVEISPDSMDGYAGSQLPWTNHSFATKTCYACNMIKQTMCANNTNFALQVSTNNKYAMYRSRSIVETTLCETFGLNILPTGNDGMLAIELSGGNSIYGGGSQEDADLYNKAASDRGLMNYFNGKQKIFDSAKLGGTKNYIIGLPDYMNEKYIRLDGRGIIMTNSIVRKGDVLISRKLRNTHNIFEQNDLIYDKDMDVRVDDVITVGSNGEYSKITFKLSSFRQYEQGNKISTRHANKGVVGEKVAKNNMPRMENGISASVQINPLGYISRQTTSLLREMVAGTVGAYLGKRQNGTSFGVDYNQQKFTNMMHKIGQSTRYGAKQSYDGRTGLPLANLTYYGVVYMLPLHHTPEDSANFRGRTTQRLVNNQSEKGLAKNGNTRFGNMENYSIVSSGSAEIHHSIFTYDNLTIPFCSTCGLIANPILNGEIVCTVCEAADRAYKVFRVPFSGPQRHLIQQVSIQGIMLGHYPIDDGSTIYA